MAHKQKHEYLQLDLPAGADGAAWLKQGPGNRLPSHRHRELELNLVLAGSGAYLVEDQRVAIETGDLLWLFPGQDHVLYDWSQDFSMWIVVASPALVRQATRKGGRLLRKLSPEQIMVRHLGRADLRSLSSLAEQAHQASTPALLDAAIVYLLAAAWHRFEQVSPRPGDDVLHPTVARAARLIREAYDYDYPLDELAQDANLSPSRLSRLFSEQMGMPVRSFRNACRLEKFFDIYNQGERYTLTEAAYRAGFGSYVQFQRVFRAAMGKSPADYRRQVGGRS